MKRRLFFILLLLVTTGFVSCVKKTMVVDKSASTQINIIPQPANIIKLSGNLKITPDFKVQVGNNAEAKSIGKYFVAKVNKAAGFTLKIDKISRNKNLKNVFYIELAGDKEHFGKEGYQLEVNKESILLKANTPAGLFYGVQTLLQLLPPQIFSENKVTGKVNWVIPCVKIIDIPRFSYRGMHLDVCRHFFPKEFIKKYIDLIAFHKMNTFHWHLTEDQGWRIEIKKYPKLTEISSYRNETLVGHYRDKPHKFDGQRYGGFYSQEDIKEIVQYAKERYVTIIPEIEMPGHSVAVLAAYPELACTEGPFEVSKIWGVRKDVYCAGNDKVFEFLENVLTEVIDLFPGMYIHIGGDECPKNRWEKCEKCQARIKNQDLKDEHELQSYFIRRIEKFLLSKRKLLIGWDEILEGGLAPEATVMSWRGIKGGIAAAEQGHDVIMTPNSHCYFDHYQKDQKTEPLAIGGFLPLKKVYFFEPIPEELDKKKQKHILGAQGNVWTEYMKTTDYVEYMSTPRMSALSEVNWSPKDKRNWDDFLSRLQTQFKRLDYLKVNYCK